MRYTYKIALTSLIFLALSAPVHAGGDTAGTYGAGLTEAATVAIVDLLAAPEKFVGKTVRVEGRVDAVCPMRGCWLDIADRESDRTVRFKVKDGEIEFPITAKGHNVVAEGVFTKVELTEDQAREYAIHLAEEQGRKFDPEQDEVSTVLYRIDGTGAVIE